jgi:hypothetical protein
LLVQLSFAVLLLLLRQNRALDGLQRRAVRQRAPLHSTHATVLLTLSFASSNERFVRLMCVAKRIVENF